MVGTDSIECADLSEETGSEVEVAPVVMAAEISASEDHVALEEGVEEVEAVVAVGVEETVADEAVADEAVAGKAVADEATVVDEVVAGGAVVVEASDVEGEAILVEATVVEDVAVGGVAAAAVEIVVEAEAIEDEAEFVGEVAVEEAGVLDLEIFADEAVCVEAVVDAEAVVEADDGAEVEMILESVEAAVKEDYVNDEESEEADDEEEEEDEEGMEKEGETSEDESREDEEVAIQDGAIVSSVIDAVLADDSPVEVEPITTDGFWCVTDAEIPVSSQIEMNKVESSCNIDGVRTDVTVDMAHSSSSFQSSVVIDEFSLEGQVSPALTDFEEEPSISLLSGADMTCYTSVQNDGVDMQITHCVDAESTVSRHESLARTSSHELIVLTFAVSI